MIVNVNDPDRRARYTRLRIGTGATPVNTTLPSAAILTSATGVASISSLVCRPVSSQIRWFADPRNPSPSRSPTTNRPSTSTSSSASTSSPSRRPRTSSIVNPENISVDHPFLRAARSTASAASGCSIGSPPLTVTPSTPAAASTRATSSSISTPSPPPAACVPGLKHPTHPSEHPCNHTTTRAPGPFARLRASIAWTRAITDYFAGSGAAIAGFARCPSRYGDTSSSLNSRSGVITELSIPADGTAPSCVPLIRLIK